MYTIGHKALTQSAIIIKLLDICIFFAENPSADWALCNGFSTVVTHDKSDYISTVKFCFYAFATWQWRAVRLQRSFVRSSEQIFSLRYLINGLSNLEETYRIRGTEYSLSPVRFWRLKVEVIAGLRCGECRRVDAGRRNPSSYYLFLEIYIYIYLTTQM